MKLTIAIPTYNRANRLKKALNDLFIHINSSENKSKILVFINDNGSKDNSRGIILEAAEYFSKSQIQLAYIFNDFNRGVALNVLECYLNSNSDYVWFLSDDDNIKDGAIDLVIRDIVKYNPSVGYFNHDQKPYDINSPYIKNIQFFKNVDLNSIIALQKIIKWPKLSSYVLRINKERVYSIDLTSAFPHIDLALQIAMEDGAVLHSPLFTAYPDNNFMDNIDFPPFVGNGLNKVISRILLERNKYEFYKSLAIENVDPLITSLGMLGSYYRGKFTLTIPLRKILWKTVWTETKSKNFYKLSSFKAIIKIIISMLYGLIKSIIKGKDIKKTRQVPID